ncbi:MAG: energy transducer TonB [Cytophagales bacterium]|nr:MAG: energy transducer TonB [Cytophagales bacterium]
MLYLRNILMISSLLLMIQFSVFSQTVPSKVIPAAEHYEGGKDSLYAFINRNLKYPITAKRNRIEGECIVKLKIDENGNTSEHAVVKNIGAGCGEEAIRVIKMLKFKAPGYSMQTSIPVIYNIRTTK